MLLRRDSVDAVPGSAAVAGPAAGDAVVDSCTASTSALGARPVLHTAGDSALSTMAEVGRVLTRRRDGRLSTFLRMGCSEGGRLSASWPYGQCVSLRATRHDNILGDSTVMEMLSP